MFESVVTNLASFIDIRTALFGFLITMFLFGLALELRLALQAGGFKQSLKQIHLCILAGYNFGSFTSASFASLYFFEKRHLSYSLTGMLVVFLVGFLVYGLPSKWILKNFDRLGKHYYLVFTLAVTTSNLLIQIGYLTLSQLPMVESVSLAPLVVCYALMLVVMYPMSIFSYNINLNKPTTLLKRMAYLAGLALLDFVAVFGVMSATEFSSVPVGLPGWMLPISFQVLDTVALVFLVATSLVFFFFVYRKTSQEIETVTKLVKSLRQEVDESRTKASLTQQKLEKKNALIDQLRAQASKDQPSVKISDRGAVRAFLSLQQDMCEIDFDRQVISLSANWVKHLGFAMQDDGCVSLDEWFLKMAPADKDLFVSGVASMVNKEVDSLTLNMSLCEGSKNALKLEINMAPVVNPYGLVSSVVGILRDRTDEHTRAAEKDKKLRHAQSLTKNRQRFYSELSHQLRTPMTMLGSAVTIMESLIRSDKVQVDHLIKYVEQLKSSFMLMRDITDQTLNLVEVGQKTFTDMPVSLLSLADLFEECLTVELKRRRKKADFANRFHVQMPTKLHVCETQDYWLAVFRQLIILTFVEENHLELCTVKYDDVGSQIKVKITFSNDVPWKTELWAAPCEGSSPDGQLIIDDKSAGLPFRLEMIRLIFKILNEDLSWVAQLNPPIFYLNLPVHKPELMPPLSNEGYSENAA